MTLNQYFLYFLFDFTIRYSIIDIQRLIIVEKWNIVKKMKS